MTLMHMALGALTSIFGAHLSWAVTDLIIKRNVKGAASSCRPSSPWPA